MLHMFPGTGTTMKVQKYRFMVLMILAAAECPLILCNSPHLAAAEGAAVIIADRHDENYDLRYERVRFTITYETTADEYARFLTNIMYNLLSGSLSNDIPLLREPSTHPISHPNRFVLVEVTNPSHHTVTLAIDVVNVYLVAYRSGTRSFFFRNAPAGANSHLFEDTTRHTLSYGGSYDDLERQAEAHRDQINLGREALINAVSSLFHASGSGTESGKSFIVVIQMICEAVRFRDIFWRVRQSVGSGQPFVPDTYMLSLETSWGQQSTRVQQSVGGAFDTPLTLQVAPRNYTTLRNVRDVIANLALMLFVCRDPSSIMSSRGYDDQNKFRHPDLPLLIRSVVENVDTCPNLEPTVRISGRNGLCVDVRDGAYHNGNPIQLWPCKTNQDPNQLWTIRSDGTIRSNGRCLTTYGYAVGHYVMIFDCDTAVTAATRWVICNNGTIFNPQSQLVLGAGGKESRGTILTVQTNVYASQQGWVVGNDTSPREVTIVGFHDLCMQEINGSAMWLEKCVSRKQEQIWTLYGDGSIRPKQNQDRCLTCLSDSTSTLVTIESCSTGSSGQRWVFTNEGTILNLNNGMVMDVRQAIPSLRQIIIYPVEGTPNQEWLPLPA